MKPKLRVLLVDDDREDFLIVRDTLQQHRPGHYQIDWASNYDEGLKELLSNNYQIALVDYSLGAKTGLELLKEAIERGCELPILFLTAMPSPDLDLAAVRSGASDFMLKGKLDADRLDRSIRYSIERKATQRIVADQQKKLSLTLKMAALGEMASGIAHEIANPLAIAQGRAQELKSLLEKDEINTKAFHKIADDVFGATQRMAKIIRSLRNFTRGSENESIPQVPVASIFEDVFRLCSSKFSSAGIKLDIPAPAPEAVLKCNPSETVQALFILLNNAFDAIEQLPERWVRLEWNSQTERDEIIVTDSGAGIPAEHHEKIFAPFFTTKAPQRGSGLGLSIAQRIMDSHGGKLTLDARCTNTCFKLQFRKDQTQNLVISNRSVLVVEDDALNLQIVAEAFLRRGFQVHTATNGEEGYLFLSQQSVGAVITDIRMPVCDGIRMIERLRTAGRNLPPVFFMTGFYERSPANDALLKDAAAVYDKPFDVSELVNHVLRQL